MIRISENKVENLAQKLGKAIRYMGEAMTCIDEMQNESESEMGERNYMGDYRSIGMREHYPRFRDDDMGERRGVPGTGRYGRY